MHQPGERWMYHTGFDVLAVLVARATNMPFDEFLAERIFNPLGMKDTSFAVPEAKRARLAVAYEREEGRLKPSSLGLAAVAPGGGSGLFSTADDYLAFARMMMNGGAPILSRPAVELMTLDRLTPAQKSRSPFAPGFWERNGWGFGMSVVTRRDNIGPSLGAYGWDGGFGTSWRNDPREDMTVIFLSQRMMTAPRRHRPRRGFPHSGLAGDRRLKGKIRCPALRPARRGSSRLARKISTRPLSIPPPSSNGSRLRK